MVFVKIGKQPLFFCLFESSRHHAYAWSWSYWRKQSGKMTLTLTLTLTLTFVGAKNFVGAMMGHQKITVNRPSSTVPRRNFVISLQIPCLIILNEAYDHHSEQNSTASPFVAFSSNISTCFCDKCQIGRGIRLTPVLQICTR